MNDPSLVPARLNVDGLSNADAARVQAFLPYCVGRTRCRWRLAPAGDLGHAVFVDVDELATISGVHRVPGGIVRVHRQGVARALSGDTMGLSSPLQLEEFIQVLQRVDRETDDVDAHIHAAGTQRLDRRLRIAAAGFLAIRHQHHQQRSLCTLQVVTHLEE